MNKLEQSMVMAVNDCRNWKSGNTYVNPVVGYVEVQLHGNIIARVDEYGVKVDTDTLREWPTATTKSRLRALGVSVYTKKGIVYVDDVAI